MSRSSAIVFVVLGAALAGFAFSSAAGQFRTDEMPARPTAAASPQSANLDWHETYGPPGEKLVFEVDRLQVLADGWRARLALTNDTSISYAVGDPRATLDREFGLMLFKTGDIEELERRNGNNTLPATRPAVRYQPRLPAILEPGASWRGAISARGPLVAGSWVRVVFGTLLAVGEPTGDQDKRVVWITDQAYELRP
jgi:hypothetical protein